MAVKLRHLTGDNLQVLEKQIEALKVPIVIVGVNQNKSGQWYIHFLVQGYGDTDKPKINKVEVKNGK